MVCCLSASAIAEKTDTTLDAYAAGYRANFTCSAVFNGGKNLSDIEEDELTGIYPLIAERIKPLTAAINHQEKWVAVDYADGTRYSVWRAKLGCVDLPIGAKRSDIERVESPFGKKHSPQKDSGQPWQQHAPINAPSGNDALDTTIQRAFSKHYGEGSRTSAILIATPEAIISEHYPSGAGPETSQRTWSVAKSIAATVIGAAVQQGVVDIDQATGLTSWSHPLDPRQHITLKHLLHMSSGLDSNVTGSRTDSVYMGGGLIRDTAMVSAVDVSPGKRWKYANNDTLLAMRTLRENMPSLEQYQRFVFDALLDKIGMQHTHLETDWHGDFILSSQVWTTSRDMARLGLLHLNNGQWQGEQILPENWLAFISTPGSAQPPENSPGYGAQWWLYNGRFPELPDDTIAARGNRGQYLVIIPSEALVIVRRGYDLAGQKGFNVHDFSRDVLQALGRI